MLASKILSDRSKSSIKTRIPNKVTIYSNPDNIAQLTTIVTEFAKV